MEESPRRRVPDRYRRRGDRTRRALPQLTFTGSDCVNEGPAEATAGIVTFDYVNDSDGGANVFVALLDEGKTVQDVIDALGPEPSLGLGGVSLSSDMGGQPPAQAGDTMRWEKSLAAGVRQPQNVTVEPTTKVRP